MVSHFPAIPCSRTVNRNAIGSRIKRGHDAVLPGFLFGIMLAGLCCGVLRAEPAKPLALDKPIALEKMRGVVVQRNDAKQVERVVVRGRKVDSPFVAALKGTASLRELELHNAELTADAWRDLSAVHQLRRLSLFNTPADFAALHRLTADRPELMVDPQPVGFSTRADELVVDLPTARLVFPDIHSCPGYREQIALASTATQGAAARVPLLPVLMPDRPHLNDRNRHVYRIIGNGIVWSTGPLLLPHQYGRDRADDWRSPVSIGRPAAPRLSSRRTAASRSPTGTCAQLSHGMVRGRFRRTEPGQQARRGQQGCAGAKSGSGDNSKVGSASKARPDAGADSALQEQIESYLRSSRRSVAPVTGYYRYGWVVR